MASIASRMVKMMVWEDKRMRKFPHSREVFTRAKKMGSPDRVLFGDCFYFPP
jgi:hypothetical protein